MCVSCRTEHRLPQRAQSIQLAPSMHNVKVMRSFLVTHDTHSRKYPSYIMPNGGCGRPVILNFYPEETAITRRFQSFRVWSAPPLSGLLYRTREVDVTFWPKSALKKHRMTHQHMGTYRVPNSRKIARSGRVCANNSLECYHLSNLLLLSTPPPCRN